MYPAKAAFCAATLSLCGCAVQTLEGTRLALRSAEFRDYVERVFREQNRVADEIAFALESPGDEPRLEAAEAALIAACADLNELATTRRDGVRRNPLDQASAARSAPRCERATAAAVDALGALHPR